MAVYGPRTEVSEKNQPGRHLDLRRATSGTETTQCLPFSRPRVVPRGGHTSAVMAMPSLTTRRGWVPAVTLPFSPRSVCIDLQLYISLGQTTELHFLPSPP